MFSNDEGYPLLIDSLGGIGCKWCPKNQEIITGLDLWYVSLGLFWSGDNCGLVLCTFIWNLLVLPLEYQINNPLFPIDHYKPKEPELCWLLWKAEIAFVSSLFKYRLDCFWVHFTWLVFSVVKVRGEWLFDHAPFLGKHPVTFLFKQVGNLLFLGLERSLIDKCKVAS